MKYRVMQTYSGLDSLEIMVSEEMERGWIPQGGVSVVEFGACFVYSQAMVRDYNCYKYGLNNIKTNS